MTHPDQTPLNADSPDQLQTLNTLIALALGTDRELTHEIRNAIIFTQELQHSQQLSYDSLTSCARRLLSLHLRDRQSFCAFAHCDLRQTYFDPLWTRQHVLNTLKELHQSGKPSAILLFSGLRQAVCPLGKRWTPARQQDYDQAQSLIEALCLSETPSHLNLRLIFL